MTQTITYRFHLKSGESIELPLSFSQDSFDLLLPEDSPRPDWTVLAFHQCPHCPLVNKATHCPAAVGLAVILPQLGHRVSFEEARIEVETPQRTLIGHYPIQRGASSLIGLVCATSGCPHFDFLRPMARFHLPFSNEAETLFRVFGSVLLQQYVRNRVKDEEGPVDLDSLAESYRLVSIVNRHLASRLRSTVAQDAMLNGVVTLDCFAQIAPGDVEAGFRLMRRYFPVK